MPGIKCQEETRERKAESKNKTADMLGLLKEKENSTAQERAIKRKASKGNNPL